MARYKAVRDLVGKEVKRGSRIAYRSARGLAVATVKEFERYYGAATAVLAQNGTGRNVRISTLDRVVVVG